MPTIRTKIGIGFASLIIFSFNVLAANQVSIKEDEVAIRFALDKADKPHKEEVDKLHKLEQWRDNLLQGDQDLFNELLGRFEDFDRQYVNQLIRNAKKEHKLSKPPKSSRLLFKYLSELQEG